MRTIPFLVLMLVPQLCGALTFLDVSSGSGITYDQNSGGEDGQERKSGGAAPGDYDKDGWVDLYVTKLNGANVLYRNKGDGSFEDVTVAAFGANHLSDKKSNGCGWADLDNDGDLDLYVLSLDVDGLEAGDGYDLFINDGLGGFTEESAGRGVAVMGSGTNMGNSVCFGDYDLDGYLDFYVTEWREDNDRKNSSNLQNNRLFHNRGGVQPGYFDDVTATAGVATDAVTGGVSSLDSTGYTARFCDIDRDGLPDILLAADAGRSRIWRWRS